jgi:hypothetical protein
MFLISSLMSMAIENVEMHGSDYYQRRTLTVLVGEHEGLWEIYKKAIEGDADKTEQGETPNQMQ